MKSFFAAALMILPVLIAAVVSYWPSREIPPRGSSVVLFLPVNVHGTGDVGDLANALPSELAAYLGNIRELQTKTTPASLQVGSSSNGYSRIAEEYGANLLVLAALTSDSGLLQLNVQVIDPKTHRITWSNAYQSPRAKYSEMIRVAGEGLKRVFESH